MFKDNNLVVIGIVIIAVVSIFVLKIDSKEIVAAGIGAFAGYLSKGG